MEIGVKKFLCNVDISNENKLCCIFPNMTLAVKKKYFCGLHAIQHFCLIAKSVSFMQFLILKSTVDLMI